MKRLPSIALALALALLQPACVVGGYSSGEGGFFIWPGSIVLTVILVAVLFLLNRRRRR